MPTTGPTINWFGRSSEAVLGHEDVPRTILGVKVGLLTAWQKPVFAMIYNSMQVVFVIDCRARLHRAGALQFCQHR
jgi:hypothetical protein